MILDSSEYHFIVTNVLRSCKVKVYVSVFLFIILFSSVSALVAQTPKMHVFAIAPDWNGKEFCAGNAGYRLSPINAPSISYSGMLSATDLVEPSYDWAWMQKIDKGEWSVVSSANEAKFLPSYYPPILYNKEPGSPLQVYSWKLIVTDIANGKQRVESDAYSASLSSTMIASHVIIPEKTDKNKVSINLSVSGGLSVKKYEWVKVSETGSLPSTQENHEDPSGLVSGIYKVTIKDGGCPDLEQRIDITNSNSRLRHQ